MHLLPLLMLASAFWGGTPACGQPSISQANLQAPVIGLAEPSKCSILVDTTDLTAAGEVCMVVVHELGHLLGLGHSLNPNDLMYPVLREPSWPCAW